MIKPFLLIGVLAFLASLLVLPPQMEQLKKTEGIVLSNKLKNSGVGSVIEVESSDKLTRWFNISDINQESNSIVRGLEPGTFVSILYSNRFKLINESYEVWQLKFQDTLVLSYDDKKRVKVTYICFFILFGVLSIVLAIFLKFKYQRGRSR